MTIDVPADLPRPPVEAIGWKGDADGGVLRLLDQTRLPAAEHWLERARDEDVVDDIRRLAVRGAPAIGLAGAYGLVLAARAAASPEDFAGRAERLAAARPTAVNLRTAVKRTRAASRPEQPGDPAWGARLLVAARDLETYERDACGRIAAAGAAWLGDRSRFLTHCNAGALVTPGLGTALAPLYLLHARGRALHVWVDETRPLLQGLRLTAYELGRAGIPHRVLVEGAAAALMRAGEVDAVITGADRVCRNGDVANKIGTYALAVAARHHRVPFLVAAPLSTLDPATPSGDAVSIEERPDDGVRYLQEGTAASSEAWAPAFDVTPAALVTALVTDRGVMEQPDEGRLRPWMAEALALQTGRDMGR